MKGLRTLEVSGTGSIKSIMMNKIISRLRANDEFANLIRKNEEAEDLCLGKTCNRCMLDEIDDKFGSIVED